ncbi:unnamed protein product [Pocillopora meandrina]|uniref:Uncharacterized protein n=1 Tax=Pocillopora meandrina TaxID=46732 RepID=A0AAU9XVS0_9CNID|nr:unnamed protein product [Pocillopora meandrina]
MEFGRQKCAKACLKKGKLTSDGNIVIDEDTELQELDQEGYTNAWVKLKEKIRKEYNRRVKMILNTELSGRIQVEAINSLAVPDVSNRLENLRTEGD